MIKLTPSAPAHAMTRATPLGPDLSEANDFATEIDSISQIGTEFGSLTLPAAQGTTSTQAQSAVAPQMLLLVEPSGLSVPVSPLLPQINSSAILAAELRTIQAPAMNPAFVRSSHTLFRSVEIVPLADPGTLDPASGQITPADVLPLDAALSERVHRHETDTITEPPPIITGETTDLPVMTPISLPVHAAQFVQIESVAAALTVGPAPQSSSSSLAPPTLVPEPAQARLALQTVGPIGKDPLPDAAEVIPPVPQQGAAIGFDMAGVRPAPPLSLPAREGGSPPNRSGAQPSPSAAMQIPTPHDRLEADRVTKGNRIPLATPTAHGLQRADGATKTAISVLSQSALTLPQINVGLHSADTLWAKPGSSAHLGYVKFGL